MPARRLDIRASRQGQGGKPLRAGGASVTCGCGKMGQGMADDYGRVEWRQDEGAAMAEAVRRIRVAAETGAEVLDFSDLGAMTALPEELALVPGVKWLFAGNIQPDGDMTPFSTYNLADLSALCHLTELEGLNLYKTKVSDLAPLSGLTALTTLHVSSTPVSDLAPLSGLTALTTLHVSGLRVTDFAPLSGLTALTTLYVGGTQLTNLAPLSGLTALTILYVNYTQVSDLAPLSGLTALTTLDVSDTPVSDLAPLSDLTALTKLDVSYTEVSSLAPLSGLTALTTLYVNSTQVTDLAPLLQMAQFAAEQGEALMFRGTPAAINDRRLEMLSGLNSERCAIETVQYLKGTHPDFRDPPNGAAPASLATRLAQAAPVAIEMQEGMLVAVNAGAPERLAPKEMGLRVEALREQVAELCRMKAGRNLPGDYSAAFDRYARALNRDDTPTYLFLDGPMGMLRGGVGDGFVTDALDGGFVESWRALVKMHDELRPLLLPPDESDQVPDLLEGVKPDDLTKLADDLKKSFEPAVEEGLVSPSVPASIEAGKELAEAPRPGWIKRSAIALWSVVSGSQKALLEAGKSSAAFVAIQKFLETSAGQTLLGALDAALKFLLALFR